MRAADLLAHGIGAVVSDTREARAARVDDRAAEHDALPAAALNARLQELRRVTALRRRRREAVVEVRRRLDAVMSARRERQELAEIAAMVADAEAAFLAVQQAFIEITSP